jgi:hypothetical protein
MRRFSPRFGLWDDADSSFKWQSIKLEELFRLCLPPRLMTTAAHCNTKNALLPTTDWNNALVD